MPGPASKLPASTISCTDFSLTNDCHLCFHCALVHAGYLAYTVKGQLFALHQGFLTCFTLLKLKIQDSPQK